MKMTCQGCVFALGDNNTQVSCELGRLEKIGVFEWEEKDGKTFAVLNRFCDAKRSSAWFTANKEKYLEKIYNELDVKLDIIIYIDDKSDLAEKITKTVNSIAKWKTKPENYFFIVNNKQIKLSEILNLVKDKMVNKNWKVEYIVEEAADKDRTVNISFSKLVGNWYSVFNCGHEAKDFLTNLNQKLVNEYKPVVAVMPDDLGNGFAISHKLHKLMDRVLDEETEKEFSENKCTTLAERVKYLANRDKNLVYHY